MFGNIFYFLGLLIFLVDLSLLLKYSKIQKTRNWVDAFFKVTKRRPNKQDMNLDDFRELNSYNSILTVNFLWVFFGLITNSWKFFLLLLFTNLFLNIILNKTIGLKSLNYLVGFFKISVLTGSIGLLVINHFHLHLDLFQIFFNMIK
jgi:hypothetical protein